MRKEKIQTPTNLNYTSRGKLVYDPTISKFFKPWWMILHCDKGIIHYYEWFLKNEGVKIIKPLWGAHVSVLRGEEPPEKDVWKKYNGEIIEFTSTGCLDSNEWYWWIDIKCPRLEEIRKELGLSPLPEFDFHITIGKVQDKCIPAHERLDAVRKIK